MSRPTFTEWIRWNLRGRPRWTQADIDAAMARAAELAELLTDREAGR